jgi:hypothetical protein
MHTFVALVSLLVATLLFIATLLVVAVLLIIAARVVIAIVLLIAVSLTVSIDLVIAVHLRWRCPVCTGDRRRDDVRRGKDAVAVGLSAVIWWRSAIMSTVVHIVLDRRLSIWGGPQRTVVTITSV